jgi:AraC family transcriptional regulator of adaptative response / DNA-3-methyladenine glycosylase II
MHLDPEACYSAVKSRDRRFDGWFFVGVSSTGIYCRPVCAVRTPQAKNCSFYTHAAAAENAGFRPCLRCRPELAPGHGQLDMSSRLAQAAARLIEEGYLNGGKLTDLAARVGVTERHLRRIFETEFGVSLIEFSQTQRLLIAKRLLTETSLSMADLALAAGFGSVRRFNDLFRTRYGLNPLRLRKTAHTTPSDTMKFELTYRPPYAWQDVLAFLAHRCIEGVEHIDENSYARTVEFVQGGRRLAGWVSVTHAPARHALIVTVPVHLQSGIAQILGRVRRIFDTACRPDLVDAHLGELAADAPGMRVPGVFDGLEIAVRAIVGQQISVRSARTVLARIAQQFGTPIDDARFGLGHGGLGHNGAGHGDAEHRGLTHTFPLADSLAQADVAALQATGIIRTRAEAIIAVAREVAAGRILLEPLVPLEDTLAALRALRGIGEWTVQYIAMRALGFPNAFPEGDAVLKKHLGYSTARQLNEHAERWAPWRAYATVHLWRQHQENKR